MGRKGAVSMNLFKGLGGVCIVPETQLEQSTKEEWDNQ
jgi:hypothetical protein